MDAILQKVIDDQMIEKLVSKYLRNADDYLKEEARQFIFLEILESNYKNAKNPLTYIQGVAVRQLVSDNSKFYRQYKKNREMPLTNTNKEEDNGK